MSEAADIAREVRMASRELGDLTPLREGAPTATTKEAAAMKDRRTKVERLRQRGVDPFPRRFAGRTPASKIHAGHDPGHLDEGEQEVVYRVAGRLVGCRRHVKATFMDLRDSSGEIEVYCLREDLSEEAYDQIADIDIGDMLGVEGRLTVSRLGELILRGKTITVLAKAIALPPKRHVDKYQTRQRPEVELIVREECRQLFEARAQLLSFVRQWFGGRSFLEVETPILLPQAAGAAARPFETHGNALDTSLFMRIATEQHLKRWLVGGFERVFEIGRCFRNEGLSKRHHFEFTMLEWIEGYADYQATMSLIEELVSALGVALTGSAQIKRNGKVIDLTPPWRRVSVRELLLEETGVDVMTADRGRLLLLAGDKSSPAVGWSELVGIVYSKVVEPALTQPTFVMDFPGDLFPLAKRHPTTPEMAESFEAVLGGVEIATGVTSLNDADEQRTRFAEQLARPQAAAGDPIHGLDEDFLRALSYGMMPGTCAGVGVDRVLMLITGRASLREAIPFPTLRGGPSEVDP
jgi:lysyl-tRNA synthetase class 2